MTSVLKSMKDVAPEERPKVGQMVNETRQAIESFLEETRQKLAAKAREEQLAREVIDVTLPAKMNNVGHRHPNSLALEEVERISSVWDMRWWKALKWSMMNTILKSSIFQPIIRQRTSRIPFISIRRSYCARRPLRYRYASWNKGNCPSA